MDDKGLAQDQPPPTPRQRRWNLVITCGIWQQFDTPDLTIVLCSALLVLLHLLPVEVARTLQWQPDWISQHAWWRLLSAHLVHTNLAHLLMNLLGLWLLASAASPLLRGRHAITLYLLCGMAISLLLPESGLSSYRGLSGVLYGGLAWLSIASWRRPGVALLPCWLTGTFLLFLLWPSAHHDMLTAHVIQAKVAHLAHWSGAVCGALYGMVCHLPPTSEYLAQTGHPP
ncbi:MAG: rhombosortase, partial [Plesiomonas sp.]